MNLELVKDYLQNFYLYYLKQNAYFIFGVNARDIIFPVVKRDPRKAPPFFLRGHSVGFQTNLFIFYTRWLRVPGRRGLPEKPLKWFFFKEYSRGLEKSYMRKGHSDFHRNKIDSNSLKERFSNLSTLC